MTTTIATRLQIRPSLLPRRAELRNMRRVFCSTFPTNPGSPLPEFQSQPEVILKGQSRLVRMPIKGKIKPQEPHRKISSTFFGSRLEFAIQLTWRSDPIHSSKRGGLEMICNFCSRLSQPAGGRNKEPGVSPKTASVSDTRSTGPRRHAAFRPVSAMLDERLPEARKVQKPHFVYRFTQEFVPWELPIATE